MMCEHGYTIDCAQCLKAQVERLRESNQNRLEIFKRFLRKTKQVRLDMLALEKRNRELEALCREVVEAAGPLRVKVYEGGATIYEVPAEAIDKLRKEVE